MNKNKIATVDAKIKLSTTDCTLALAEKQNLAIQSVWRVGRRAINSFLPGKLCEYLRVAAVLCFVKIFLKYCF